MDEILKNKFLEHTNLCKERFEYATKELEKYPYDEEALNNLAEQKIHNLIIEALNNKGWKWGKDRLDRDRLSIITDDKGNKRLERIPFRHKYSWHIEFIKSLRRSGDGDGYIRYFNGYIPNGFAEIIKIIANKLDGAVSLKDKICVERKTDIEVDWLTDDEIRVGKITEIRIDGDCFEIESEARCYNLQSIIYNDKIFEVVKELLEEQKLKIMELREKENAIKKDIEKFIEEKLSIILIKTRLTE